jgi:hypothetical protein
VIELEAAAAKIEDVTAGVALAPDVIRQCVEPTAAVLLDYQQAGFSQNAQMLRDVVLRDFELFRDLVDAERLLEQELDNPHARFLADRLERRHAVRRLDDGQPAHPNVQTPHVGGPGPATGVTVAVGGHRARLEWFGGR